jgi:hypothetical protein
MRHHLTPLRWSFSKDKQISKQKQKIHFEEDVEKLEPLCTGQEHKMLQLLWKTMRRLPPKIKNNCQMTTHPPCENRMEFP